MPFTRLTGPRMGKKGGKISAAKRKGNSAWGHMMLGKRGAAAQARSYPGLKGEWARNATRELVGQPKKPLPEVNMTPRQIAQRERRRLEARRRAHERGR
jgi:hypothetical protein